jgi:RNA polymerase-binding transcription factor DksA
MNTTAYKTRLEEMLVLVTGELAELGVHNPENPDDWIATPDDTPDEADPVDSADRVEDWNERVATLAELETRYNNIRRALTKIEEGTYGVCEVSGEPIEQDRLDANPAARTCKAHLDEEDNLE